MLLTVFDHYSAVNTGLETALMFVGAQQLLPRYVTCTHTHPSNHACARTCPRV